MKKVLLTVVLFFKLAAGSFAQTTYGNEWIDPSRPYLKIYTDQDVLYHIGYNDLQQYTNIIPQNVNIDALVMYCNGKQIPLYIYSTDQFWNNGDYIEFRGVRNVGKMDSLLYASDSLQINQDFSLFTLKAACFLTVNNLPNNARLKFTNNILSNLPPKLEYWLKKLNKSYNPEDVDYYGGQYYSLQQVETYKSTYDVAEGYVNLGYGNIPLTLTSDEVYTQGPDPILKINYTNNSNEQHNVTITVNNTQVYPSSGTQNYFGFKFNKIEASFPISLLPIGTGVNTIKLSDIGPGVSAHKNAIGSYAIIYPRTFNFSNTTAAHFELPASATNQYIEITGFIDQGTQPLLYDFTNSKIYRSIQPPGTYPLKFNLEPSVTDRVLTLRADNQTTYNSVSPANISAVNFTDFTDINNQGEYYIITNKALLTDDGSGNYWVEEYRKYRDNVDNPSTGKYNRARIVDVELLYDQFGYGITKSPLGIRNFINYMAKSPSITNKTKYVFLIGKARESIAFRDTQYNATTTAAFLQCLVPTFGYPGSDNLLAASRESDTMCVAIGRLAATNVGQVRDYLTKVKTYEEQQNTYDCAQAIAPKEWQKQILHFSGGTTLYEQFSFKSYLDQYAKIASDSLWGVNVTSFSKSGTNPIDVSLSQIIRDKINSGASWLTFFGHSATGAFDFSIDEPENYTNTGKYPIILSNGCFAGFIHDAQVGYSERFVFGADRGAVAFIATSNLSAPNPLNNFSDSVYTNLCRKSYNQPLGKIIQHAQRDLLTSSQVNDYDQEVAYEMTLHGDPGLKPNTYPKPDFAIEQSSVYTTPTIITPGTDSFDVNIIVTNLGKSYIKTIDAAIDTALRDSILVTLKRTVFDANNNPVYYYYSKKIPAPFFKDTMTFKLPVNISTLGYGQNLFEPYVDAGYAVDEMAECNNGLTTPYTTYIQNDDVIPIYPYEFAIVPEKGVTLKASTINPFASFRNYRVQIDTSELFNSSDPLFRDTVISQVGGVIHWKTSESLYTGHDSTVYYWRIKKDSVGATWHYSSFVYIQGEDPGWNQSHFHQYLKDDYQNISIAEPDRTFKFPPSANSLHVRTGLVTFQNGPVDYETLGWDYNNYNEYRYRMGLCDGPGGSYIGYTSGLTFAVIDTATGFPWVSHNYDGNDYGDQYGNIHCLKHSNDQYGFDFLTTGMHADTNISWSQTIASFIDAIPQGHYVLIYSVNQVPYTSWDNTLIQALGQLGLGTQQFTNGSINGPFVFFAQKGNTNNPFFAYKNGYSSALDTSFGFNRNWYQGSFTSPKIGPAVEWKSVHWRWQTLEGAGAVGSDRDSLEIIGVDVNGAENMLYRTGAGDNFYNGPGLNSIDANTYPYLRLRLNTRDDSLRTPTQLYYWRVLYKKPPEAAINPAAVAQLNYTPNVVQGSNFHLEIPLENVTEVPMDSMLTKYVIRDANLNNITQYARYQPLPGLQTMMLTLDYPINGNNYLGLNKVIIEANPDNDQLEQYHFNNIAEINFNASGDKINPLLDVTFDNEHILSGDIVSAKPNILITLKDENKYLALDNEALIDVYIKYPGETEPRKLVYDNNTMKFYPANAATLSVSNKAQVELKPEFTVDGTYELLIKDRDRSGNNSATTDARYQGTPATFFDYKISFEVVTKASVTNVLNYPNPFTTSTRFVFTLTGSEVPDVFKIQIINIKGTVVKEIFKDELGPIHIGRNITEYAWDGRDQYGDLLANGIYFYHVVTKLDDKELDHRGMSYDKYFKKGFGKMAIIR